jgi:hypothetical protein
MNNKFITLGIALLCIIIAHPVTAQEIPSEERIVIALDSGFWKAYNNCDVDGMKKFFTDDIEFYHDKGGKLQGIDNFLSTSKKNLCSDDNFRLRRDAVAGTVQIYPMKSDNKVYGAILSGQHVFYIVQKGKPPRLDGLARFTHLWILTESGWKMSRVLSYDHGPAQYVNQRKEVKLNKSDLSKHVGTYLAPKAGKCTVALSNGLLELAFAEKTYQLHAESKTVFFQMDRDLTFEFVDNKMIVREFGEVVEEAVRTK